MQYLMPLPDPDRLLFEAAAVTGTARLLAAATMQGTVRVWEIPAFREVREFWAASGAQLALGFSSDGRRLVTANARQEGLQVWDVATWQQLIAVKSGRAIAHVSLSADGNQLTGVESRGAVLTWRLPTLDEIEAAERKSKVH